MYATFSTGLSAARVCSALQKLNAMGIPEPVRHHKAAARHELPPSGLGHAGRSGLAGQLSRRILRNPLYTGTMVQGKTHEKLQTACQRAVPEEDWITVEQTHEAIIPIELFAKAQSLFARDTRTAPTQPQVYLFSGFLRCADCGKAMNRKLISAALPQLLLLYLLDVQKAAQRRLHEAYHPQRPSGTGRTQKRSAARLHWPLRWMS